MCTKVINKDPKDYYKILELERTATATEIKKAYLKLIRKFHPDTTGDDPKAKEKFNEIAEAYQILGNLDNRLKYSVLLNRKLTIPKYLDVEIKYYSKNKR